MRIRGKENKNCAHLLDGDNRDIPNFMLRLTEHIQLCAYLRRDMHVCLATVGVRV